MHLPGQYSDGRSPDPGHATQQCGIYGGAKNLPVKDMQSFIVEEKMVSKDKVWH